MNSAERDRPRAKPPARTRRLRRLRPGLRILLGLDPQVRSRRPGPLALPGLDYRTPLHHRRRPDQAGTIGSAPPHRRSAGAHRL